MSEQDAWDIYFASICSLRFHPKNDEQGETALNKVEYAAMVADLMVMQRRMRCRGE